MQQKTLLPLYHSASNRALSSDVGTRLYTSQDHCDRLASFPGFSAPERKLYMQGEPGIILHVTMTWLKNFKTGMGESCQVCMSLNCGWVNHTCKLAIGWSTVCYHGNPKFLGLQIGVQTLGCLCKTLTKWMKLLPLTQDFPYNYMRLHPLISETPPIIAQTPPPPHCWTRPPANIASS